MNNLQFKVSKINIKMFAFRCKSVRFAKAYVNHILALPSAMYSHSVFVCTECLKGRKGIYGIVLEGEKPGGGA